MLKNNKLGFSLAEILLAVAIVSVVAIFGFKIAQNGIERAYDMFYYTGYSGLQRAIQEVSVKPDITTLGENDDIDTGKTHVSDSKFLQSVCNFLDGEKNEVESTNGRFTFKTPNGIIYRVVRWQYIYNGSQSFVLLDRPNVPSDSKLFSKPEGSFLENPLPWIEYFVKIINLLGYLYFGGSEPSWYNGDKIAPYAETYLISMSIPATQSSEDKRMYFVYIPDDKYSSYEEQLKSYLIPVGSDAKGLLNSYNGGAETLAEMLGGGSEFETTDELLARKDLIPYYLGDENTGKITTDASGVKSYHPYNVTTFKDAYCKKYDYNNIELYEQLSYSSQEVFSIFDCGGAPSDYNNDDFSGLDFKLGNPRMLGRY